MQFSDFTVIFINCIELFSSRGKRKLYTSTKDIAERQEAKKRKKTDFFKGINHLKVHFFADKKSYHLFLFQSIFSPDKYTAKNGLIVG